MSRTESESGRAAAPALLAPRLSPVTLIVAGALIVAASLAWAWLLSSPMYEPAAGMSKMGGMAVPRAPFSAGYLVPAFTMWSIMMIAMMVPSAAPMILLHARVDRSPSPSARLAHALLFGAGYVLVWTAFSAAAAVTQAGLITEGAFSGATLSLGSRGIAAVLLFAAALYELTAAKRVCLTKCQSPLLFFYRHWRPGGGGAFRLGIVHGAYCLGCCWALMLLLFVGGVMNLAWVALLGILVIGEKLAPARWYAEIWVAIALTAGATILLIR